MTPAVHFRSNERFKVLMVIEQVGDLGPFSSAASDASLMWLIHFQPSQKRAGWRVLPERKWQQMRRQKNAGRVEVDLTI
jgi:hypothetical protein